jgi:hypothetical protein
MKKLIKKVAPRYAYVLGCFMLTGYCCNSKHDLFLGIVFFLSGVMMLVETWSIIIKSKAQGIHASHNNIDESSVTGQETSL